MRDDDDCFQFVSVLLRVHSPKRKCFPSHSLHILHSESGPHGAPLTLLLPVLSDVRYGVGATPPRNEGEVWSQAILRVSHQEPSAAPNLCSRYFKTHRTGRQSHPRENEHQVPPYLSNEDTRAWRGKHRKLGVQANHLLPKRSKITQVTPRCWES